MTRSCDIPAGSALFFPLVNGAFIPCWEGEPSGGGGCAENSDDTLRAALDGDYARTPSVVRVVLDGVDIDLGDVAELRGRNERTPFSGPAMPDMPADNDCLGPIPEQGAACGETLGASRYLFSDGYWAMLAPLPSGQHTLRIYSESTGSGSPFVVDATYELRVR